MKPRIEVLVSPDCPHAAGAIELASDVCAALVPEGHVQVVNISSEEDAQARAFAGSPTILVNGRDVEPEAGGRGVIACRLYPGGHRAPARWKLEASVLAALAPKHILFLCVANSARSQMAEGVARSLAPEGVTVSSAGSVPTQVRPQAIEVLREIGIDISSHRSKAVEDVDASSVQAGITLCAEEVCPVFLGRAHRLHWGLSDPAAAQGSPDEVLESFRNVRDQLRERLSYMFGRWQA